MADPSQTTSPGDKPVRAEPTELRDFDQRIAVLTAQLEVQQAISRALDGRDPAGGEGKWTEHEEVDVDELPDDVVRSKLKEVLQNNKKLKADLREKAENTKKALEILKTSNVPPSL